MSYYSALAPFYDAFMGEFPYQEYLDLCESVFGRARQTVSSVLDLACGTGTLSCLLAERGYDVVACDGSAEMLSEAQKKRRGDNPLFICQKMEELDLFGTVSAALCSLDGLNHLSPANLDMALARLHLFMEPEAPFLFDVNTAEKLLGQDGACFVNEVEGAFCVWQADCSGDHSDFSTDLFVQEKAGWRRESAEHREYVYRPVKLEKALLRAGFQRARCLGELLPDCPGREFWLAEA